MMGITHLWELACPKHCDVVACWAQELLGLFAAGQGVWYAQHELAARLDTAGHQVLQAVPDAVHEVVLPG
jgi:hypothetical protein